MEELNSLTKPTLTDVDIQNRLSLLLEFLQCNEVLYLWQYDTEGNCLWTNSSLPIYDTMLRHAKDFDEIIAFGQEHDTPLMITSLTGMMWSVVYQKPHSYHWSGLYSHALRRYDCPIAKAPRYTRTLEGQIIRLSASGSCCYNNKFYQIHTYASL